MHSSHRSDRPTRPQRPVGPTRRHRAAAATAPVVAGRQRWIAACAARLCALRPGVEPEALLALATELWSDLSGHDPEIAAEMEQESRGDD